MRLLSSLAIAASLGLSIAAPHVLPRLRDLMVTITKDDPKLNDQFRIYLVDWYLHRVYDELDGPLSDAIAAVPRR